MEKQIIEKKQQPIQQVKKPIQKILFEPKIKPTRVVNVKKKFLNDQGYKDFEEWSNDPNNVYIGRNMSHYVPGAKGSKWANLFKVEEYGRDGCIQKYREYILNNKQLMEELPSLKGKTLGCWCKPQGCHGDVLVQLVNKTENFIKK